MKIALKKIKNRPEWYQKMVNRLQNHIGDDWATQLHYLTIFGMFPTEHSSVLEPEALLQLFVNEWVDLTIVFFFTSYFYEASSEKPNPCAFLNTNTIAGDWLKSHRAEAEEHISSLYSYHSDKEYFLASYLAILFMWGDAGVATEAYIDKLLKSIVPPLFERGIR
ncbi:hypothetical protein R6Q59_001669 [Mikania micrantha]